MKRTSLFLILGLFVLSTTNALAGMIVLDFDDFQDGQIIDDEYFSQHGVTINSMNYIDGVAGNGNDVSNRQVAFNTLNDSSRDNDLEYNNNNNDYKDPGSAFSYSALNLPGYAGADNPGNILILQENGNGCSDGICDDPDDEGSRAAGYFEFVFDDLVSILNLDFFDTEDTSSMNGFNAIEFYDENDNEVHAGMFVPEVADGQFIRQGFNNINDIKRMVINMPGSGGIDNLVFTTTDVPEPHSWLLLSAALALLCRRKV
ncbi:hypothetical protein [Thalassomonas haliotis]|uniref:PEP-CTERM protein-sorting domain-containing protein n=1 Tax=Thalassomonas haliotis TaxID=485448 RepID=A0ABY7V7V7_9GAMM|nr:hypothetical protein [Thalassomonas haliotis]WDE09718.1 hypothetical protein H3N35_15470 [Thalassomonas haliotis]